MPTLVETVTESLTTSAAEGVGSYSADGETTVNANLMHLLEVLKWAEGKQAAALTNRGIYFTQAAFEGMGR